MIEGKSFFEEIKGRLTEFFSERRGASAHHEIAGLKDWIKSNVDERLEQWLITAERRLFLELSGSAMSDLESEGRIDPARLEEFVYSG